MRSLVSIASVLAFCGEIIVISFAVYLFFHVDVASITMDDAIYWVVAAIYLHIVRRDITCWFASQQKHEP